MENPRASPVSTIRYYTFLEQKKEHADRAESMKSLISLFSGLGDGSGNDFPAIEWALHDDVDKLLNEEHQEVEEENRPVTIFRTVDNDTIRRDKLYQPLDTTKKEFRIVRLSPGLPNEPISCDLVHESFLNPSLSSYQPLSYVVGDVDETKKILINGVKYNVTSNLYAALRHVREALGECSIWIDQLCINQFDAEEKSSQVLLMREIFGRGRRTIVWIPDKIPDKSDAAAALIRLVFGDFMAEYNAWFKTAHLNMASHPNAIRDLYMKVCAIYCKKIIDPSGREPFRALQKLVTDPYWERCWIWQEICVSKESLILWGKNIFRWEELAETVRVLTYSGKLLAQWVWREKEVSFPERKEVDLIASSLTASYVGMVKEMRTSWWERTPNLRELLVYSRNLKCTDPRDKIYGILGLVRQKDRLTPEYRTTSMAAACVRATMKCIRTERSLDILCEANERERHYEWRLPSWTPDFSVPTHRSRSLVSGMLQSRLGEIPIGDLGAALISDANATKGLKLDINFSNSNARVLHVKVIKFLVPLEEFSLGTIGSAENPIDPLPDWQGVVMGHGAFSPAARHPVFADEPLFTKAFVRTIGFGMDVTDRAAVELLRDWARELGQKDEITVRIDEQLREALLSGNWRFFIGHGGMTGMAPAATEAGDQLCFIPGARVPFVIRERREAGGGYILVGGCYIHGYMHGKIVEDLQKNQVHLEWANLH